MILAVCGLQREARIVSGAAMRVIVGGGDGAGLRSKLDTAIAAGADGVISIGIAGALSSSMKIGDCVIAARIVCGDETFPVDAAWTERLTETFPEAVLGTVDGSNVAVATTAEKARLNAANGACAVDMESHIAARAAQAHGIPFAALRVISDRADHALPPAALVAMKPDGSIAYGAVLRSLIAQPGQIPHLIETGRHSEKAFAVLRHCRDMLGADLGCPYRKSGS